MAPGALLWHHHVGHVSAAANEDGFGKQAIGAEEAAEQQRFGCGRGRLQAVEYNGAVSSAPWPWPPARSALRRPRRVCQDVFPEAEAHSLRSTLSLAALRRSLVIDVVPSSFLLQVQTPPPFLSLLRGAWWLQAHSLVCPDWLEHGNSRWVSLMATVKMSSIPSLSTFVTKQNLGSTHSFNQTRDGFNTSQLSEFNPPF